MDHKPGRRRTKRLKAMQHVQTVALRLFDQNGFRAVTIEQVAEAADVSESSIYRYFGTKEGIVLADPDFPGQVLTTDASAVAELDGGQTDQELVERVQRTLVTALNTRARDPIVQDRLRYLVEVPDLQAALALDLHRRIRELTDMAGGDGTSGPMSFDAEIAISATYGAVLGALQHWRNVGFDAPLDELLERAIERINTGLATDDSTADTPSDRCRE